MLARERLASAARATIHVDHLRGHIPKPDADGGRRASPTAPPFQTFLADVRCQRSELGWRPQHCQVGGFPARGRPPTAANPPVPLTAQPPAITVGSVCTLGQLASRRRQIFGDMPSWSYEASRGMSPSTMERACHSLTLYLSGRAGVETADPAHCPSAAGQAGLGPPKASSCSVARNSTPKTGISAPPPARARSSSNGRHLGAPVAVLCCCTLGPGCSNLASDQVELRGLEPLTPCLQTTGRPSTRVHRPQVTVPGRASESVEIRVCCGTSLLYSPPWAAKARGPDTTLLRCHETPSGAWWEPNWVPGLPR